MEHVINAGYKKYSTRRCIEKDETYGCIAHQDELYLVARHSTNQQYKLWEPLDYVDMNSTEDNELGRKFEWFGECREKKAMLGWRSENEFFDLEMKLRRKHKSAHISLGKEFIFSRHIGWRLHRYGSIKILKRMWTLVESGVYNELLNISCRPPIAHASRPRKLAIHGNIFVQFVLLSGGLLLAFLIFIAEFYKTFIRCFRCIRDSAGFLITKFSRHSQEAFLVGLRHFLITWVQLLNQRSILLFLYNSCRMKTKRCTGGKTKLVMAQDSSVYHCRSNFFVSKRES